ncbi:MAG: hypothetical protein ACI4MW_02025, partial [Christensenellales bacterium]
RSASESFTFSLRYLSSSVNVHQKATFSGCFFCTYGLCATPLPGLRPEPLRADAPLPKVLLSLFAIFRVR